MLLILIIKVLSCNGAVQYVSLLSVYPHLLNTWDMILFSHLKDWELWKCYSPVCIIICIIVIEGGSSRSHYVEEPFWKRLWTCRQTDYWMNEWMNEWLVIWIWNWVWFLFLVWILLRTYIITHSQNPSRWLLYCTDQLIISILSLLYDTVWFG